MNEQLIFSKALKMLQAGLDFPEALTFKIEPAAYLTKRRAPDLIFMVRAGPASTKDRNKLKDFKNGVVEAKLRDTVFIAEIRKLTQPRHLRNAIFYLKDLEKNYRNYYPLIIAPFIGPSGRALCRREGVSYVDTLGNIGLFWKDGFIIKESRESIKSETRGLKSLFAIKSTRVTRVILEEPARLWKLQDLANSSKVSLGQVYNVIKKLLDEEYVEKTKQGIKIIQPWKLLDDWVKCYKFTEFNTIDTFYSGERNYHELLNNLARTAEMLNYAYAFTLFAAASLVAPYVRTPFIHLYLAGDKDKFAQNANLKPVTSGGNVSIIRPYDEGILNTAKEINGLQVVGNIQLYLDLICYPARGKEQAEMLRGKVIGF
jgi:hypothetical protein